MKKVLITTLLAITASFAFAQGTVNFNNKVSASGVDGVITYAAGTTYGGAAGAKVDATTHATAQVALYGGADGTPEDQLVLIVPAVGFRTGAAAGYVNVGSAGSRAIPGVLPGQFAIVQIRAWDTGTSTASYEAARGIQGAYIGKSNLLRLATGGAGSPPGPAADLIGLQAFALNVPEPGTIALGFLGLGALLMFRRKK